MFGPVMGSRVDIKAYPTACELSENFWPRAQGPLTRIPGTILIDPFQDSAEKGRLIQFSFSALQKYLILMTNQKLTFYQNDVPLEIPAITSTIEDGGFTAASTELVSSSTITASTTSAGSTANLKDTDGTTYWASGTANSQTLDFDFGAAKTVRDLKLTAVGGSPNTDSYKYAPNSFTLKGSATGAFAGEEVTILTVASEPASYGAGGYNVYRVTSPGSYRYYRLTMTGHEGANDAYSYEYILARVEMYDSVWTDVSEFPAYRSVASGVLQLDSDGASIAASEQQVAIVEAGARHVLRFEVLNGPINLSIGTTSGGATLANFKNLQRGVHQISFLPGVSAVYIRFYHSKRGIKKIANVSFLSAGRYTLDAPWTEADMGMVQFDQQNDTMYLTHDTYPTRRLERRGNTSWSLVYLEPDNGPFGTVNTTPTRLYPSDQVGEITLRSTLDQFTANDVRALYELTQEGQYTEASITREDVWSDPIKVIGVDNDQRRVYYEILGVFSGSVHIQMAWSETDNWTDIDYRSVGPFTSATSGHFDDTNTNTTVFFRIGVKAGEYTSGVIQVKLSTGLLSQVGVVRILSVTNAREAVAEVLKPLVDTRKTAVWRRSMWTADQGYPRSVAFGYGRLALAGGYYIWCSESDNYTSFQDGDKANNAFSVPVQNVSGGIKWIRMLTHLAIGAEQRELILAPANSSEAVSGQNFQLIPQTWEGSSDMQPVEANNSIVFLQRGGHKLMQFLSDPKALSETVYTTVDLTRLSPEILQVGAVALAIQRTPERRIYVLTADGKFRPLLFRREEEIAAWSYVNWSGNVEDICVVPSVEADSLYYIVKRRINGVSYRFIEKMGPDKEVVRCPQEEVYVQCALSYLPDNPPATLQVSGTSGSVTLDADADVFVPGDVGRKVWLNGGQAMVMSVSGAREVTVETIVDFESADDVPANSWSIGTMASVFSGLDHLEGQTVWAWADLKVYKGLTVSGGSVTLPEAVSIAHIGLPLRARWKSLKMAYGGDQGTALCKKKAPYQCGVILHQTTEGTRLGATFDHMFDMEFTKTTHVLEAGPGLFSGEIVENVDAAHDSDARLVLEADHPGPAEIQCLVPQIATNSL